ncbi:hypothetical protein [Formosa sp. PL04]|uniref:hypothetical protein n=1 Tax=Formosa sp. PL04 TaxID=3081755 RepID=UPI0029815967|nr:hypothetical protein [Formosa sp. PL04]MDW5287607.1 hypothetical protein [Formosa sp. PL04]
MKKIMILALVFISINAFAQQKKGDSQKQDRKEMRMQGADFTPEQQATLQTKKMTLNLDLSDAQQKEVYNLNIAQAKERQTNREAFKKAKEAGQKPTDNERYTRMVAQLDNQILVKTKMKSILKSEQYAIWEKDMANRKKGRKNQGDRGTERQNQNRQG